MSLFRKMRKKGHGKDETQSDSDSSISTTNASSSESKKAGLFDKIFKQGKSKGEGDKDHSGPPDSRITGAPSSASIDGGTSSLSSAPTEQGRSTVSLRPSGNIDAQSTSLPSRLGKPVATEEREPPSKAWGIAKASLKATLTILAGLAEDLPIPGKGAIGLTLRLIETREKVTANKDDFETLTSRCDLLKDSIVQSIKGKDASHLPPELMTSIGKLIEYKGFEGKAGAVAAYLMTEEDSGVIKEANDTITRLLERFWLENHIAGRIVLNEILTNVQDQSGILKEKFLVLEREAQDARLDRLLRTRAAAAYDSQEVLEKVFSCFEGTREALLSGIGKWASSPHGTVPSIYVLDGIAGIGKSTILITVAARAGGIRFLGASFFFSRDHERRKTTQYFVSTISFQLACYNKEFGSRIGDALQKHPDATEKDIRTQFTWLITEPLRDLLEARTTPLLIAIDALDECDERQALALLTVLLDEVVKLRNLKVFITTRPESGIRHLLEEPGQQGEVARFHVQDIEQSVVQADIQVYLDFRLAPKQVQLALPALPPPPWQPTIEQKAKLVLMAGKLFIIAYTATEFILDKKQLAPDDQLETLLEGVLEDGLVGSDYINHMDRLYMHILRSAAPTAGRAKWLTCYQDVVGTVIVLQNPLPQTALAALLGVKVPYTIRALENLHSILAPTGDAYDLTFHIHHKSFSDFVTTAERCEKNPEFLIETKAHHTRLALRCFEVMDMALKPNLCGLGPKEWYKVLKDLPSSAKNSIGLHLAYACTYWAIHLELVLKNVSIFLCHMLIVQQSKPAAFSEVFKDSC
ncbi:hypothetical protein MD484_g4839, partial [Candolleomyces efflorescens]